MDTEIQRQRGRERKEKQIQKGRKRGGKETDEERVGRRDTEIDG
jgi:hypothetical protein